MKELFQKVLLSNQMIKDGWTSPEKAVALAAAVVLMRPRVSVEIGVYAAKGLIPMALAHKEINFGNVVGIDPWSSEASAEGQLHPDDKKYWGELNHEEIYEKAKSHVSRFNVEKFCQLVRSKAQDASVPEEIGVLRIDGNHGEAVLKDVERFAPACVVGAFLFLDDIAWTGGAVGKAAFQLVSSGWRELYKMDDGLVFQKVK